MTKNRNVYQLAIFCVIGVLILLTGISAPAAAQKCPKGCAAQKCQDNCPLSELQQEVGALQEKIKKLEKENKWAADDIDYMSGRLDKAEMHTATDRISFSGEFRTEAHSIHYDNIRMADPALMGAFFYTRPEHGL